MTKQGLEFHSHPKSVPVRLSQEESSCISLCLCKYTHVFVYASVDVHLCMCTYVWRPEVNLKCSFLSGPLSFCEPGSLKGTWCSLIALEWLVREPQASARLCPANTGITSVSHHAYSYKGSGNGTQSSWCVSGTLLSCTPSLGIIIWGDFIIPSAKD